MKNALFGAAALTLAVAIAPSSAAACNDPDFNYFTGCTLQQFADIWVPANLAWIPPGAYPFEGDFSVDDGFPSDGYWFAATIGSFLKNGDFKVAVLGFEETYDEFGDPVSFEGLARNYTIPVPAPEAGAAFPLVALAGYLAWRRARRPTTLAA